MSRFAKEVAFFLGYTIYILFHGEKKKAALGYQQAMNECRKMMRDFFHAAFGEGYQPPLLVAALEATFRELTTEGRVIKRASLKNPVTLFTHNKLTYRQALGQVFSSSEVVQPRVDI